MNYNYKSFTSLGSLISYKFLINGLQALRIKDEFGEFYIQGWVFDSEKFLCFFLHVI